MSIKEIVDSVAQVTIVPVSLTSYCVDKYGIIGVRMIQGWPEYMGGSHHTGIDVACRPEDLVFAVESGKITHVSKGKSDTPSFISIKGDDSGRVLVYKHVQKDTRVGDRVVRGQVIGMADNTGVTGRTRSGKKLWDGYHLHFSVKNETGDETDPVLYLMEYNYGMLYQFSKNSGVRRYYEKKDYWEELEKLEHKFS